MRVPKKLSDRIVYGVFGVLALWSFVAIIINPFGMILPFKFFARWKGMFHSITIFCLTILFLLFYSNMEEISFSKRFVLSGLFCWLSYHTYDIIWETDRMLFWISGFSLVDFFGRIICSYLIPLSIVLYLTRKRWNPEVLTVNLKRLVLVVAINFVMILWLESTGFYYDFYQWWYGEGPDPHGWVWFIGKAVGMLSFALALKKRESY